MKKVLSLMLVFVFCIALMSVTAFAELPTYMPAADGTYSIDYTEGTASNYYALLIVEGEYAQGATPTISEDTVLYIDQATADSNGAVSFGNWIPKNAEPATVYLGGSNLSQPVLLGYLGQDTFNVSGSVTSQSLYEATVTLTNGDGDEYTVNTTDGAYSIVVPEDTYTVKVTVKNHLSYTDVNFAVSEDVTGKNASVLGGDLNADGTINDTDLSTIVNNYTSGNTAYDVDGDGDVDYDDLAKVTLNYGENAVNE